MGLIAIRQNRQFRVIFFIVITVLKMHVNAMIEKLIQHMARMYHDVQA